MRRFSSTSTLLAVLLMIVAVRTGVVLSSTALATDTLPQWDGAKYGVSGLRMADAVRRLDPLALLAEVDRSELWPPLFALLQAPVFLAAGDAYHSPLLLTVLFAVATIVTAWWAGRQIDPETGDLVGALAALALAASPMQHLFGALVMLEAPGALLLLLAVGSYARWLRTGRPAHARAAWIAAAALFFLKYNYGISWLLVIGLGEAWRSVGSVAGARAWVQARFAWLRGRGARPWLVAAAVAALAALAVFGSRSSDVGGVTHRNVPIGWPIWAIYAALVLRAAATPRRSLATLRAWHGGLSEAHRALATWVGAPIALWMLLPRHVVGFFTSLENRASGPSLLSLDNLTFYPLAFVREYAWAPWLGLAALLLATLRMCISARAGLFARPHVAALAIGFAAAIVHPYKEPRFLFTMAPLIWLAAADALAAGMRWLAHGRAARQPAIALAVVLAASTALTPPPVDVPRLRAALAEHGVHRSVRSLLDAVVGCTATAGRTVLLGYWNGLSPALVEWHARWRSEGPTDPSVPIRPRRLVRPGEAAQLAERALGSGVRRILVVELAAGGYAWGPGWEAEIGWLDPARAALLSDPRWIEESFLSLPQSGYSLRVYRPATD